MSDFNWSQFLMVGIIALLVGGLAVYTFLPKGDGLSQSEVNSLIANASAARDAIISDLQAELAAKRNITSGSGTGTGTGSGSGTVTVITETGGYLIDDLFLEDNLTKTLSDREISLFDGTIDFNSDSYDADETFFMTNLVIKANENDFEGKDYLTFPADSLVYKIAFEPSLDITQIGVDDETLTFNFLGKDVEVLEWVSNSVTFVSGKDYLLTEGQNITVEGKNVQLVYVSESYAYVSVDGVGSKVNEGTTKSINGLEVRASDVLYRSKAESSAELKIAKDVETTINDGDEYELNSPWVWVIDDTTKTIGLKLNEGYLDLDDDFSPLAPKDEVCLPDKYVCVKYNGLSETNGEQYTFDMNEGYVVIRGDLATSTEDLSRVYVNSIIGLIYKKVGSSYTLITGSIKLGNTDSLLTVVGGNIVVEDFEVDLTLTTTNIPTEDFNQMTDYGILVENTETALDDNSFTITVPEEKVSGSITIKDVNFKDTGTTNSTSS